MQLIGIAGKAGSGKTTVAQWLGKERAAFLAAFAYQIKETLIGTFGALTGLSWQHFEDRELKEAPLPVIGVSPRRLAQTLGTEFGRNCVHPDVWVMLMEEYLRTHQVWERPGQMIVLHDLRFENEARWIRNNGGTVVHLSRPSATSVAEHASEAGVAIESGDQCISNGGDVAALLRALDTVFPQRAAA